MPQPSPAYHSAIKQIQGGMQGFVGTPDRLSQLRGACLVRDRHRCVITRKFDYMEARNCTRQNGDNARDDDGAPHQAPTDRLEVAHILPTFSDESRCRRRVGTCFQQPGHGA